MVKTIAVVSVKKERHMVPRERIIEDLLGEVRESLSITEVQIHLKKIRDAWMERKRGSEEGTSALGRTRPPVWEERRGTF